MNSRAILTYGIIQFDCSEMVVYRGPICVFVEFSSPGPAYVLYPRHKFTQSFIEMDVGADFSPFAVPRYAQSYDDVAPGAGNTPLGQQQSTHNDHVDARADETESVNISVNRGKTNSCATRGVEDARENMSTSSNHK